MNIAANSLAFLLAACGAFIVACNDGAAIVSGRNKRHGIDHHVSMVPVIPQLCLLLAYGASCAAPSRLIPTWVLLVVGLADLSLWGLAAVPILYLLGRWPPCQNRVEGPSRDS